MTIVKTLLLLAAFAAAPVVAADKPNILFVTVDDMSCDSVGVYGCKLAGTTPTVDKLAADCLRFNHAHVQVGNCMPSRNVMFSGRYPHNNRVEGFYQVKSPGWPHLVDLLHDAGYFTAIRGKVSHSTPYSPYPAWDLTLDRLPDGKQAHIKDVESYYTSTKQALDAAKEAGMPFYVNINISDPHKPFYNESGKDPHVPSRVFTADEVPIPGFLFDDPQVREELALYYSSVRRADDCLAGVLRALDESGRRDDTLIVFLSDHGMPLPFAKTQLYYHSTHTPLMIRVPGLTTDGAVDDEHLVSSVDFVPTILDVLGLEQPKLLDGRSFAPVLHGKKQPGRDMVVTEYNENAGGNRNPMRAVMTRDYGYIFNPWSDGSRKMATATMGTITYRRMKALAPDDPALAARLDLFEHRVPEEFYHYAADVDARQNLIDSSEHRAELDRLTAALEAWMVRTRDPMLGTFQSRDDPAVCEAYQRQVEKEAAERRTPKDGAKKKARKVGRTK